MVLELLMNPRRAERTPWEMFFVGFVYAIIGLLLAVWIFPEHAGLVMVFLTTLACTYLVQGTLRREEAKDEVSKKDFLLKEHRNALTYLVFLFIGFVVAFSLLYIFLPATIVESVFDIQIRTIGAINSSFSADTLFLSKIFFNNIKVLFFCVLFAFFYGAGAVFILAWNASIVGAAIGTFVRTGLAEIAQETGLIGVSHYLSIFSLGLLRYMTHGVFEILAYFTAALGAGIISIAVVRHNFGSKSFMKVVSDSSYLILLSVVILFLAALIEVYVTPLFF